MNVAQKQFIVSYIDDILNGRNGKKGDIDLFVESRDQVRNELVPYMVSLLKPIGVEYTFEQDQLVFPKQQTTVIFWWPKC